MPSSTISNPVTGSNQPILIPNPEYVAWSQQDQLILSTLIASLLESILSQVLGCNTSHTLWVALECMFISQSQACVMQIQYQLATSKKGNSNVIDYFQRMHSLGDTLATIGQALLDIEMSSYILDGLRTEYNPFVTSVTTRVDPLSLDELYGYLLAHEQCLEQQ